jgi:multidrug resistance protein
MTAGESTPTQMEQQEQRHELQLETSKNSEKFDEVQAELESIASALQGDGLEDEQDGQPNDLEKAPTQASHGPHEPATRIVTAVDWNGPNDPENPLLWPTWKKIYSTVAIGSLAFAVTIGTSMISPATPLIAEEFGIGRTAAILPLTLFTIGLATGPLIAAPISETWGRTVVYKVTGFVYLLFLVGSGFSKSFASLLVCRLLAGIAGGPVLAVGAGSIADMFHAQNRAVASSFFIMMPFLGPSLGPVIGGFAAQFKGWRWTQWCTIFIAVAAFALVVPMPETYKKVILSRRAKKHGVQGPPKAAPKGWPYIKLILTVTLTRPIHMLFTEPIVLFFSLYNSFTFSVLFAFFAAYPYTFTLVYHFNTWQYGLTFLGILIGVLCAVATVVILDRAVYLKKWRQAVQEGKTLLPPEQRLYAAMVGSFTIPVG